MEYQLETASPARKAIATKPPTDIAIAAVEFITGPLIKDPWRVGKPLAAEFAGIHSARLATNWRILYRINRKTSTITVLDIRPRSTAYRSP